MITPPAVVNEQELEGSWKHQLTDVMNPLRATYTNLLLGKNLAIKNQGKVRKVMISAYMLLARLNGLNAGRSLDST